MEGSANSQMEVRSSNWPGETDENQENLSVIVESVPAQIPTEAPSNTRPHSVSLFRITEGGGRRALYHKPDGHGFETQ
jgi:hypothetical protein